MNYTTESENNEETIELLTEALNDIALIVNTKPMNSKTWTEIRRIINQTNMEVDF